MSKLLFLTTNVVSYHLYRQEYFCTNNSVRVGNNVTDILTSEDIEYATRVPDVVTYELYEWSIFH